MPSIKEMLMGLLQHDNSPLFMVFGELEELVDYLITNGVAVHKWIPVEERLPEEHNSMFANLYGTNSWQPGMFRKCSNTVLACAKRTDGERRVVAIITTDGKWDWHKLRSNEKVTHWMPLPAMPEVPNDH